MHGFNTQTTEGDYRIQFQTDSRDEWLLVQQLCRDIMDGKKLSQPQWWTSVSERPPEDQTYVLVSTLDNDVQEAHLDGEGRFRDCYGDKVKCVIAWMPKPEPYEERQG